MLFNDVSATIYLLPLSIIITSYVFYKCFQKIIFIRKLDSIPGPETFPFIGSYHVFLNRDEFLNIIMKFTEKYSSPFQIWLANTLLIVVHDPVLAKIISTSKDCINKSLLYKYIPLFGTGLVTTPEPMWSQIRRMSAPAFTSSMLKNFFNIITEQSVILTDKLEQNLNENEIILLEYLPNCTFITACDTMVGVKLDQNKNNQYLKIVERLKNTLLCRIKNILLSFDIIFNLTTFGRKQKKDTNLIHFFVNEMIQQRRQQLNNSNTIRDKNNYTTFFDIFEEELRKKHDEMKKDKKEDDKPITEENIRDIVLTMLIAASETISIATNFAVFMIANFPQIQEKVYEEMLEIYGTETVKSTPIKHSDLQQMHYLESVIKETMRLFPPIPLIGRQITKQLQIGEIVYPKGTNFIIPILKIHRNETYWPNPLMFDPDRFLDKRNEKLFTYLPFSAGRRDCLGQSYGMMGTKIILATLIRTFIFKVNKRIEINDIKLKYDTGLSVYKPLKVKIEKRLL